MAAVEHEAPGAASYGKASGPRAGFWRRFGGALVDGILLGVIGIILRAALKNGAGSGVSLLLDLAYFTYFVGSPRGQTPGMMAVGIRVISFDGNGSIGYARAFVRWIGSIISTIFILIGYLWMLWDKEKQCWHDKLASDVVVPVADYPVTS
jgi:uncharacterized RDD family membrane protein YckC